MSDRCHTHKARACAKCSLLPPPQPGDVREVLCSDGQWRKAFLNGSRELGGFRLRWTFTDGSMRDADISTSRPVKEGR